ncbi:hypothetical protein [Daejeonella sp. H1SJ63]|nr:hypothetical protein [Daejeonella sp. H1SJ63]
MFSAFVSPIDGNLIHILLVCCNFNFAPHYPRKWNLS